jgi:hypothetical protein
VGGCWWCTAPARLSKGLLVSLLLGDELEVFKIADDIADDGAFEIAGARIQRSKSVLLMFLK